MLYADSNLKKIILIPIVIFLLGVIVIVLDSTFYPVLMPKMITDESFSLIRDLDYTYFVLVCCGIAIMTLGIHKTLEFTSTRIAYPLSTISARSISFNYLCKTIIAIISHKKYLPLFWSATIGYGILYASISAMVIYRADNFSTLYGVSIPSIVITSIGPVGYAPTITAYLTQHFGLLIIPINLYITLTVSALVGLNTVLSIHALKIRHRKSGAKRTPFLGIFGFASTTSLFAACPTCASFYIFNIVLGSWPPTIAAFTSNYYFVFLGLSIPLLIVTPFITAFSISKTMTGECRMSLNHNNNS
jgi:hypothetical protein